MNAKGGFFLMLIMKNRNITTNHTQVKNTDLFYMRYLYIFSFNINSFLETIINNFIAVCEFYFETANHNYIYF